MLMIPLLDSLFICWRLFFIFEHVRYIFINVSPSLLCFQFIINAQNSTVCSHISNMITGVTKGYKYKMRFCYAHFPINVATVKEGSADVVEIRNYLGEKTVRRIKLLEGVNYTRTADVKDQIEISGIDINKVSLSCARITQSTAAKHKDIRKFLDGIYVSERGHLVEE